MLEQSTQEVDFQSPAWGGDAPRGGKAVLNRIIKEKATVPLFFGQTLLKRRMRDAGLPPNLSGHSFRVAGITDLFCDRRLFGV